MRILSVEARGQFVLSLAFMATLLLIVILCVIRQPGVKDESVAVARAIALKGIAQRSYHDGYARALGAVAVRLSSDHITRSSLSETLALGARAPLTGPQAIQTIGISGNGKKIVALDIDLGIARWQLNESSETTASYTREPIAERFPPIAAKGSPNEMLLSRSGNILIVLGSDALVWSIERAPAVKSRASNICGASSISSSLMAPNDDFVAVGCEDGRIEVWTIGRDLSLRRSTEFQTHAGSVRSISISSDSKKLVSTASDHVIVWDINNFGMLSRRGQLDALSPSSEWSSAVVSSDGRLVIANNGLWDISNPGDPRPLGTLDRVENSVVDLAISADSRLLAVAELSGPVTLWDITNASHPAQVAVLLEARWRGESVALSPDGNILVAGSPSWGAFVWNIKGLSRDPLHDACHEGWVPSRIDRGWWREISDGMPWPSKPGQDEIVLCPR